MFSKHGLESVRQHTFLDNSIMDKKGLDKLLELQALSEISSYLAPKDSSHNRSELAQAWTKLQPNLQDNLVSWDRILNVRNLHLVPDSDAMDIDGKSSTRDRLSLSLAKCFVALGESAVSQSNVHFTHYCLKKISRLVGSSPEVAADRESIKSRVAILNFGKREDLTAVDNFCSVFKSWNKHLRSEDTKKSLHSDLLHKDVVLCLNAIVSQNPHITPAQIRRQLKAEEEQKFFESMFQTGDDHETFRKDLAEKVIYSFDQLRKLDFDGNHQKLGNILMEGANFLHDLIDKDQEDGRKELLVEYHLNAMKVGSVAARQLFPRLLPVLSGCKQTSQFFSKSQESVPAWMFLPWSNQLISSLHNEQLSKFIFPLAVRIAEEYPNAIIYAVQICAENSDLEGHTADLLAKLMRQLKVSPVHQKVLHALSLLAFPHIGVKDLVDSYANWKQWYPDSWQQRFNEECDRFAERFLSAPESQGGLHRQFAKEFAAKIKSKDINKIKSVLETQSAFEKKHVSNLLKDFSPFLASFQGSDYEDRVEMPGQYGGLGRPDPGQHACIAEFGHTLTIFSSIRKPILLQAGFQIWN
jgi:hypothetical protein